VSSKVTGKLVEVAVEEGMAVREGQILARLDDSTVRSQLALAEARLAASKRGFAEQEVRQREAELTLGRTRRLVDEGVIGRAEIDAAEAEVDSLAARIALAREQVVVSEREIDVFQIQLNDMVIRAPFSGIAISKDAEEGEMISPISAGGGFTRNATSPRALTAVVSVSPLRARDRASSGTARSSAPRSRRSNGGSPKAAVCRAANPVRERRRHGWAFRSRADSRRRGQSPQQ
jgi:multidrug efflux pump subunit AcrA (membrane-fusion protein)